VKSALAPIAVAEHPEAQVRASDREHGMQKNSGKKKEKCKNCEGKGLIKNGDKKMKCQRCGGTGFKP
jgi:DnaJ-class molecular chaperone